MRNNLLNRVTKKCYIFTILRIYFADTENNIAIDIVDITLELITPYCDLSNFSCATVIAYSYRHGLKIIF